MPRPTLPVLAGAVATAAVASVLVAGSAAAGSDARARVQPPQPVTGHRADHGRLAAPASCDGGAQRRSVFLAGQDPIYWTSGTQEIGRSITTTKKQRTETLVVTFESETWTSASLAYLRADVLVDGTPAAPYDDVNPNAIKSGESYADTSLMRCIRVKPGKHTVTVRFTPVGSGSMWVDDYLLRIDQLG